MTTPAASATSTAEQVAAVGFTHGLWSIQNETTHPAIVSAAAARPISEGQL
jgi:hypothetical protein